MVDAGVRLRYTEGGQRAEERWGRGVQFGCTATGGRRFGGFGAKPPRWMAPTVSPNLWVAISQFRLENRGKDPKASRGVTGKET